MENKGCEDCKCISFTEEEVKILKEIVIEKQKEEVFRRKWKR